MKNIYDYSKASLEKILIETDIKKFRATQIYEWIYKKKTNSFSNMLNISKETRENLEKLFAFSSLDIINAYESEDGTRKYLFRLNDDNLIETVLMKNNYGYSVCVSSQVGCSMGCSFCASGLVNKKRDLLPHEMLLQVLTIDNMLNKENARVSHIVIMGIGEPFDNYENVLEFISIINDPKGLEIGSRHITLSTCGIIPKIYAFADFPLQVNLAISLHFATDDMRSKYMRVNKKYNLLDLKEALKYYFNKTSRRITFEYILLAGINDSVSDANKLADYVIDLNCYVNLIPYNDTSLFKRSNNDATHKFYDALKKRKINVTLRREQGHDISAACGQLRINKMGECE